PALFAALAYSFLPSPAYLMTTWRYLAQQWGYAPWGFLTQVRYEEAGHSFAVPLALLAVAAAWRNRWLTATLLTGFVFLTNSPALIGLGFMFAGLTVARARDLGFAKSLSRVAGMVAAGYGLSAFWMTPGYFVSSTLLNRVMLRHTLPAGPWNTITWMI